MPADVANRAGVHVALDRLQLADDLQRADLRRAGHGAGGEGGTQHVGIAQPVLQATGHLADDVHDVAVAFDHEALAHLHAARLRHAAYVVAAEVDQHQVLGALLGVGQQLDLQRLVFLHRAAARARTGDGAHRDLAALQAHQDLRRGAHDLGAADVEEVHVRRRIERAQRAVHVHRARTERHAHALAEHHLERIAGADVVLHLLDRGDEALAGEAADEVGFVQRRRLQCLRIRRAAVAQAMGERIQPAVGARPGLRRTRVGVDDEVEPPLEVVEHRQLVAEHQQDVGRAQFVGPGVGAQARLDVLDAFEAEPADQAAGEARQSGDLRHPLLRAQALDLGQRIGHFARLHHLAVLAHGQGMTAEFVHPPRRQADDRVAPEALAAFHRLEQIGVRAVRQLEVDRQRGVEVGQHLAHHRDQGVALSRGLGEAFLRGRSGDGHVGIPWTIRQGRTRRHRHATIARHARRKCPSKCPSDPSRAL